MLTFNCGSHLEIYIFVIRLYHSSPSLANGWLGLEIRDHDFSCMSKYGHILSGFLRHLQLKGVSGTDLTDPADRPN